MIERIAAAQYTEVSLDDMEKFLKRAFRAYRPRQGKERGEIIYDLRVGEHVGIRVWTSIRPGTGMGAGKGADAIRVQLISLKDKGPLKKGKSPIVKRTQKWRHSLLDRINELEEEYAEKDEFWENWASTRSRSGDPKREMLQQEKLEKEKLQQEQRKQEVSEQPPTMPEPEPARREVPLEKLRGDSTPKQHGFILGMLRRTTGSEWQSMGLERITGLSWPLSKRDVESMSKRDASQVISKLMDAGKARRYASFDDVPEGFDYESDF